MRSNYLLLLVGSVCLSLCAFTQSGTIKGKVITSDGKPAEFVNITLKGTGRGTIVNQEGYYSLANITPGSYTLTASFTGLVTQNKDVSVTAGAVVVVDFTLAENQRELQEVVVSASKSRITSKPGDMIARMPINNLQNPQAYNVVGQTLMKQQNTITITDAFRNAPGVTPVLYPSGGIAALSRGFSTDVNARNGLQTTAGRGSADIANIERLEFIKGPAGTLFGAGISSFGGVVNLVTKKPYDNFGGSVDLSMGSFSLGRVSADINTPLNDDKTVLLRVNAAAQKQDSYNERGFNNSTLLAPSLLYKVSDRLSLLVDAEFYSVNSVRPSYTRIAPGAGFTSYADLPIDYKKSLFDNDLDAKTNSTKFFVEGKYKLGGGWTSTTNVSYVSEEVDRSYQDYPIWISKDSVTIDVSKYGPVSNAYTNFQQNFNGSFFTGAVKHTFLAGVNLTQYKGRGMSGSTGVIRKLDIRNNNGKIDRGLVDSALVPGAMLNWGQSSTTTYGAYVSDVINFSDRFYALLGLRYEYLEDKSSGIWASPYNQSSLSPKIGLVYQLVKDQVSIFGNYMNGYQNYAPVTQPDGSRLTVKPIYAYQYEGGIKAELLNKRINATLSYYTIRIDNAVRYDNDFFAFQDGEQESKGIEVDVTASPVDGLSVILGYGYNDNKILNSKGLEGKIVSNSPQHIGNAWINYQFKTGALKHFGLGLGGNYISKAYFDDANEFLLPAYKYVDASVFFDNTKWRLGVKLNNIGDEKSWGWWGAPNPTRHFVANFTVRF